MIIDITKEMFLILFITFSIIAMILKQKKNIMTRLWVIISFIIYLLLLIKVTIFPIYLLKPDILERIRADVGEYWFFYQIVPFESIRRYLNNGAIIQLLGNLVLLAPLVVYIVIFFKRKIVWYRNALICSSISGLIELIQLMIDSFTGYPGRVADIDDFILNTIGIMITIGILKGIEKIIRKNGKVYSVCYKLVYE